MTRDMELIRKIVLAIETRKEATLQMVEIEGVDKAILARHLEMMLHADLIEGEETGTYNAPYPTISVKDLSWSGHDFAAVLGNETVWGKIKQSFSERDLIRMPLDIIGKIGVGLLTEWAKTKVGLS